jgi:D-arabinose 1-dehydrogenase-like Zn-dependent alcohol dehydrogenase
MTTANTAVAIMEAALIPQAGRRLPSCRARHCQALCRTGADALQKLGGAQVILATAPSSRAMSELFDFLGANGKLVVIGVTFDPIEVSPAQLITGRRSLQGWTAGTAADSEDTLRFAELNGARPMVETYPLAKAGDAYACMMSGKAQFRVVLTM